MNIDVWVALPILLSALALVIVLFALFQRKSQYTNGNGYSNTPSQGMSVLKSKLDDLEIRLMERDERIKELRREVDEIKKERDATIEAQNQTIATLRERVSFLERLLYQTRNVNTTDFYDESVSVNPQTLLITSDDMIQKADEIALNRARVNYRRITNATVDKIRDEFRRRRSEGRMYKYLVFSAHMSERGIQLAENNILDPYWLNTNLSKDVELVILNGCESISIADKLAGVVNNVISVSEKVDNEDAASFLTAFWKSFVSGKDINDAFQHAKSTNPSMSPFVDLQYGGEREVHFIGD